MFIIIIHRYIISEMSEPCKTSIFTLAAWPNTDLFYLQKKIFASKKKNDSY